MTETNAQAARGGAISRRRFAWLTGVACLGMATGLAGCAGATSAGQSTAESGSSAGARPDASPSASADSSTAEQLSTTLFVFDTVVTLTATCAEETLQALVDRCNYFESKFSRTIEESDIGRINAAGGAPVEVAPETADIIQKALAYCEQSAGRFDITIGAVSSLWDFKNGVVPDADALAEAVKHVDYRTVRVDGATVTLDDPQAKLDLGGVAKGYIADDLCQMLADAGCASAVVNLGGNVKTVGTRPDGKPWHVGIQDPNDARDTVVAAVYSEGTSVVTSGLYERQFEADGRTYWHILDPETGYPVETDLVSASILSDSSLDGDGFATQLFLMGHDGALAWIESHDGIEGLVVNQDGTITQSSGCNAELL